MPESVESCVPPRGLTSSIVAGYQDSRASTRTRLAAKPRAAEIYAWLAAAGLLIFTADLVAKAVDARARGAETGDQILMEWTVSAVLGAIAFVPVATALTAVPVWLVLRFCFRGEASCWETVVSAAWAVLLAAPVCGLASLLQAGVQLGPFSETQAGLAIGVLGATALVISIWIWSQCTASAHAFRSGRWVFLCTAGLCGAGWSLAAGVSVS